jgi:7-dehydrocholesterol reductase
MVATRSAARAGSGLSWSSGKGLIPQRDVLGPLFLMLSTPPFSIVFYYVVSQRQGDFVGFGRDMLLKQGLFATLREIWPSPWLPGVWTAVLSFAALQLVLMKAVPGNDFVATVTPNGVRPVYKANGMACFLINLGLLLVLAHWEILNPALLYDYFGNVISTMNLFALAFCLMLFVKGHVAPSGPDSGTNGSIIQDFYWVRLYGICGECNHIDFIDKQFALS